MSKQSYPKNCLVCGFKGYKTVFSYNKPDEYERSVGVSEEGYSRKWVRCSDCGFYYSVYSRDKNAMDRLYASPYYRGEGQSWRKEGSTEDVFRKVIALPEKESVTKQRIRWIKESINDLWGGSLVVKKSRPPYKMLDVGGGNRRICF